MGGKLTTHVLDTTRGCPAMNVRVELERLEGDKREHLGRFVTNPDGRVSRPLLEGKHYRPGVYELIFHVGDYLDSFDDDFVAERFLEEVPIRFRIADEEHYHVPLLVSPHSYTTYRGS